MPNGKIFPSAYSDNPWRIPPPDPMSRSIPPCRRSLFLLADGQPVKGAYDDPSMRGGMFNLFLVMMRHGRSHFDGILYAQHISTQR